MHLIVYTIKRAADAWTIKLNESDIGANVPLPLAIEAAVRAAYSAHQQGHESQVILCDGELLHTVWRDGQHSPAVSSADLGEDGFTGWLLGTDLSGVGAASASAA